MQAGPRQLGDAQAAGHLVVALHEEVEVLEVEQDRQVGEDRRDEHAALKARARSLRLELFDVALPQAAADQERGQEVEERRADE